MDFEKQIDYKYIFKYTTAYIIWKLLFIVFMIWVTLYLYSENRVPIAIVTGLLTLTLFLFNMHLLKDKPIIKISDKGIWTKALGFKKWKEINNIKIEDKTFFKYLHKRGSESMFIYLSANKNKGLTPATINIMGLEKKELLRHLVEKYLISKDY